MTKNEMILERAKVWENAKAFLNEHEDKKTGQLSAEDNGTYEKMEASIEELTKAINRAERAEKIEAQLSVPTSSPIVSKPVVVEDEDASAPITARKVYRDACISAIRTNFQRVQDVMVEGTDAAGGYLVPDEWDKRILKKLDDVNIMRGISTVISTSGEHKINIEDGDPVASWIGEGASLNFTDAAYAQIILDAHKLHVAVKVSEELLFDNAYNLERSLIDKMGSAVGRAEEDAFLNGNGTGKPTGIFDITNGGTLGLELASADALDSDTILDLIYKLRKPYRKNARFIMNDKTVALIRKFKDQNGAYIWQPSYQAGEPDRICGYPVLTSAYAPEMATEAPEANAPFIAFGDFSYYQIGDRGKRSFQMLKELFAGNGQVGYVLKQRVDGILGIKEAVQLAYIKA